MKKWLKIFVISFNHVYRNVGKMLWYGAALDYFAEKEITDSEYNYDEYITRGEVAYILYQVRTSEQKVKLIDVLFYENSIYWY